MKKLSARNIIPGTVTEIVRGETTALVKIDIGGGNKLTASITVEAVDDLALSAGDKVSAIIKASAILVGK
jgi:molybdopterin-binding protein